MRRVWFEGGKICILALILSILVPRIAYSDSLSASVTKDWYWYLCPSNPLNNTVQNLPTTSAVSSQASEEIEFSQDATGEKKLLKPTQVFKIHPQLERKLKNKPTLQSTAAYPRLVNVYLRNHLHVAEGIVDVLKNWDYVILSPRVPDEEIALLKAANPDIKIGRWFGITTVWKDGYTYPWAYDRELYNKVNDNDWWMHDANGGRITSWPGGWGVNFSHYCPEDENGEKFYDWFPDLVFRKIQELGDNIDFLYMDELYADYFWYNYIYENAPIDIDNDGIADSAEKINTACEAGLRIMISRLKELLQAAGKDMVMGGNGCTTRYPDLFNGAMREFFPYMHGRRDPHPNPHNYGWGENMFNENYGYFANDQLFLEPHFSLIAASPICISPGTPPDSLDQRHIRFTLGSCLLGDGYFCLSIWNVAWWLDKYYTFEGKKGYLGNPQGDAVQIIPEPRRGERYGVYQRNFSDGLVLVNASGYTQKVELDKRYINVADETILTDSVNIEPWDALILVKKDTPLTLDPSGDQKVFVGGEISFDLSACHPEDAAILTYTLEGLPAEADFFLFHYREVDINRDGKLNLSDFAIFGSAYNSSPNSLKYRTECDFNRDGKIDISDFEIFKRVYSAKIGPLEQNPLYNQALFGWRTGEADLGSHQITFTVTDGEASDSETITIDVVTVKVSSGKKEPRIFPLP